MAKTKKQQYAVKLTWPMISALVDIEMNYKGADSYRYYGGTLGALVVRGLILTDGQSSRLTPKGKKHMELALELWMTEMAPGYRSKLQVTKVRAKKRAR